MEWALPETYDIEVSSEDLDGEPLKGKYNIGYRVHDLEASEGEPVFDSEEYVLWTLLDENTPETDTYEDLTAYHLARARNAEVMDANGLNVPNTALLHTDVGGDYQALFLATPYIDHTSFEQRPKFPGGDSRRNNPHVQDPFESRERRLFEASIDKAMDEIDGERLVRQGKIVNAGDGDIDGHNKNWGTVNGELMRLDIGEVPAEGPVWTNMAHSGPEEFYAETGLRNQSRELLHELDINPEESIPEDLRDLMKL